MGIEEFIKKATLSDSDKNVLIKVYKGEDKTYSEWAEELPKHVSIKIHEEVKVEDLEVKTEEVSKIKNKK